MARTGSSPAPYRATTMPVHVQDVLVHALTHGDRALLVVEHAAGRLRIAWVSAAVDELLGVAAQDLVGTDLLARWRRRAGQPLLDPDQLLRPERATSIVVDLVAADGSTSGCAVLLSPAPSGRWWSVRLERLDDGWEQVTASSQALEDRFAALVERTPVATLLSDVGLRLAHVNDAFAQLVEVPAADLLALGWLDHVVAEDLPAVVECVHAVLEGRRGDVTARLATASGGRRWTTIRLAPSRLPGQGAGFVGTVEDVTDRRAFDAALAHQVRHDQLTGLPNRTLLLEHLQGRLVRDRDRVAVLFVDLDDFKVVNDSLGHQVGDAVLADIALRLRRVADTDDLVARFGGDEFVLVADVGSDDEAEALAGDVVAALTAPVEVDGQLLHLYGSVGLARASQLDVGPDDLIRDADIAMYRAKASGKNQYAVCDDAMRSRARAVLETVSDLRDALAAGGAGLYLVYQPVLGLGGSVPAHLSSVEALVRWQHPTRGLVGPDQFIAVAEQHHLISDLSDWVLDTACAQMARWRTTLGRLAPHHVNVNMSALQLPDGRLPARVADTLQRHGVPASALCLEITESALVHDPVSSRRTLQTLRDLGVTIAIDDFGTGYSSLAYLQHLPIDYLKIDRSFVRHLGDAARGPERAVAAAIVTLASNLGLQTVAEGVETIEQAQVLVDLGCGLGQGWLLGRPMAGHSVAVLQQNVDAAGTVAGSPLAGRRAVRGWSTTRRTGFA